MKKKISIIIPFFDGNKYLPRLFKSIESVIQDTCDIAEYEVIVINDSPKVKVIVPKTKVIFNVKVLNNEKNLGIQASRIQGIDNSNGEWVIMIDQDDELCIEGFRTQVLLADKADVVVGNGEYNLKNISKKIYSNKKVMTFLLKEKKFIQIRNLIPSPGETLIKKKNIPDIWKTRLLDINGSDDWLLWILMFKNNNKFVENPNKVYIHNDAGGNNLSANLYKMKDSSLEMLKILIEESILDRNEYKILKNAIYFKFFQDTKQLTVKHFFQYKRTIFDNVRYKLTVCFLSFFR